MRAAIAGGATRRCLLTVLTRRDAAGTSANVATEINAPPTTYHRVDSNVELKTPPDPHQVRLGPVAATRAGVAVLLVLVVFLAGIPVAIVRAKQLKARGQGGIAEGPVGLVGAWAALVIGSGFLLVFAALGWEDWRSYADYRATTCNVFGSTVQSFTGGTRRTERSYRPLFAVRYDVAGVGNLLVRLWAVLDVQFQYGLERTRRPSSASSWAAAIRAGTTRRIRRPFCWRVGPAAPICSPCFRCRCWRWRCS